MTDANILERLREHLSELDEGLWTYTHIDTDDLRELLDLIQSQQAMLKQCVEALAGIEPYLDAIVCFASTMDEHEPNRLAKNVRDALLATLKAPLDEGDIR